MSLIKSLRDKPLISFVIVLLFAATGYYFMIWKYDKSPLTPLQHLKIISSTHTWGQAVGFGTGVLASSLLLLFLIFRLFILILFDDKNQEAPKNLKEKRSLERILIFLIALNTGCLTTLLCYLHQYKLISRCIVVKGQLMPYMIDGICVILIVLGLSFLIRHWILTCFFQTKLTLKDGNNIIMEANTNSFVLTANLNQKTCKIQMQENNIMITIVEEPAQKNSDNNDNNHQQKQEQN